MLWTSDDNPGDSSGQQLPELLLGVFLVLQLGLVIRGRKQMWSHCVRKAQDDRTLQGRAGQEEQLCLVQSAHMLKCLRKQRGQEASLYQTRERGEGGR